jgi:hypothetical protein
MLRNNLLDNGKTQTGDFRFGGEKLPYIPGSHARIDHF